MTEVEAAAERLDKEMNTDLESDCEAVISVSKINKQQPRQISTTTTTMSKSNNDKGETSTTTVSRSNNGKGGISSTAKPNNLQRKNDNGNLL